MDGLNCNEIQYSELFPNNTIFRLDAEFFSREAITIEKKIKELIDCPYDLNVYGFLQANEYTISYNVKVRDGFKEEYNDSI